MSRSSARIAPFVAVAALFASAIASAATCTALNNAGTCAAPKYVVDFTGAAASQCPPSSQAYGGYLYCLTSGNAPGPVTLSCENTGGGYICEAIPQGDGLTYGWSGQGIIFPYPGDPTSAIRSFSCFGNHGHSVTVTVTGPNALSTSYTRNLSC